MFKALIAYGGNMPSGRADLASTIERALAALAQIPGLSLQKFSRRFRSPAWPPGSGPDFLNGVVQAETQLTPDGLLAQLHGVEEQLGRTRRKRWEARVCDLDLLAIEERISPDRDTVLHWIGLSDAEAQAIAPDTLILPHPRLHQRAFVLAPMNDVAPDWRHPILGHTVSEMWTMLPAELQSQVEVVPPTPDRDNV